MDSDDELERAIGAALDAAPRIPGVDWSMALSVSILRVLEERFPGFRDDVKRRLENSARLMEGSGDPDDTADAPSLRKLIESWVFTEATPAGERHEDRRG